MDLTVDERSLEIEIAIKRHISQLERDREDELSRLPRGGKAVETTTDLSREQKYKSRVGFLESCLLQSKQIGSRLPEWLGGSSGRDSKESYNAPKTGSTYHVSAFEEDDEPFYNPFSGKLIVPHTIFSPGPSGTQDEAYIEIPKRKTPPQPNSPRTATRRMSIEFDLDFIEAQRLQNQYDEEDRLDQLAISRVQAQWNAEDELIRTQLEFARNLAEKENSNIKRLQQDLELAKKLQRQWSEDNGLQLKATFSLKKQWDEENSQLEEQRKFAQEVWQIEQERDVRIKGDMAAAQKAQLQWEKETRQNAEQARRLAREQQKEQQILEEEKRRIVAKTNEAHRLARIERERKLQEEAKRRQNERQEAEKKARQLECLACMDEVDMSNMCILACKHGYCRDCAKSAFEGAKKSRELFQCCGKFVPVAIGSSFLSSSFVSQYQQLTLELTTTKPRYCSKRSCSSFLAPQHIQGSIGVCPKCRHRTCTLCGNQEHAGICPEDKAGKQLLDMAKKQGWKTCPGCSRIVQKLEGCLHMTCKCGSQWCWNCLRNWGTCNSTCRRR